jgi:hypothetical protein
VAERLGRALQKLPQRFESAQHLKAQGIPWAFFFAIGVSLNSIRVALDAGGMTEAAREVPQGTGGRPRQIGAADMTEATSEVPQGTGGRPRQGERS